MSAPFGRGTLHPGYWLLVSSRWDPEGWFIPYRYLILFSRGRHRVVEGLT